MPTFAPLALLTGKCTPTGQPKCPLWRSYGTSMFHEARFSVCAALRRISR